MRTRSGPLFVWLVAMATWQDIGSMVRDCETGLKLEHKVSSASSPKKE